MKNNKNLKKKILYRSIHRGFKEMDLLLGSFVKKNIEKFDNKDLDQDFDNLMRADQKLGELFSFFSMLAIAIACLGPLAQTLYYLYLRGFRPHQQVF